MSSSHKLITQVILFVQLVQSQFYTYTLRLSKSVRHSMIHFSTNETSQDKTFMSGKHSETTTYHKKHSCHPSTPKQLLITTHTLSKLGQNNTFKLGKNIKIKQ